MYEHYRGFSPGFVTDVKFKRKIYFEKYDEPGHTTDERVIDDTEIVEDYIPTYLFFEKYGGPSKKSMPEILEKLKESQAKGSQLEDTEEGVRFETEEFGTIEINSEDLCALFEEENAYEEDSIIGASVIHENFYFTFASPLYPHLEYPNNCVWAVLEPGEIVDLLKSDAYEKIKPVEV